MVICSQLHILNDSLENIQDLAITEMEERSNAQNIMMFSDILDQKLKECIQHHTSILE